LESEEEQPSEDKEEGATAEGGAAGGDATQERRKSLTLPPKKRRRRQSSKKGKFGFNSFVMNFFLTTFKFFANFKKLPSRKLAMLKTCPKNLNCFSFKSPCSA
jgi:hypothetical protein